MKFETEFNESHQALIKVQLEPEYLERKKRQVARKLSKKTKIPGFRPGKAPYNMVARFVGEANILEEAVEALVDELYPKALEESEIKPYGPGKLENMELEGEPEIDFLVPLAPEVELGDYRALQKPYQLPEVSEEMVAEMLEALQEMRAKIEPVERPAEESDLVNIQLVAEFTDDSAEEKEFFKEEKISFVIEPEDDDQEKWPFPGFSRQLIGLSVEDEKNISHTYPDDYENEILQGKTLDFSLKVLDVNARTLPELTDELAHEIGRYEDVAALREDARRHLEESTKEKYDDTYFDEIIQEIISSSSLKYPPEAVEDEVEILLDQLKNQLANQGLDLETYLKTREMKEEELREELAPEGERRVKRGLVMLEVARKEDIEIDPQEVQDQVTRTVQSIAVGVSKKDARRVFSEDVIRGLTSRAINNSLIDKTLLRLRAIANGELEEPAAQDAGDEALEESDAPEGEDAGTSEPASEENEEQPEPETLEPEARVAEETAGPSAEEQEQDA